MASWSPVHRGKCVGSGRAGAVAVAGGTERSRRALDPAINPAMRTTAALPRRMPIQAII
jgi:hypothetical protein